MMLFISMKALRMFLLRSRELLTRYHYARSLRKVKTAESLARETWESYCTARQKIMELKLHSSARDTITKKARR